MTPNRSKTKDLLSRGFRARLSQAKRRAAHPRKYRKKPQENGKSVSSNASSSGSAFLITRGGRRCWILLFPFSIFRIKACRSSEHAEKAVSFQTIWYPV